MGSFPYPPNGMVEIDYEHILIFKKPGESVKQDPDIKKKSEITKDEWKEYFSGHWYFGGAKQIEHQAMFPEELPKRLIKMFSFYGETVLDPFAGSGTTAKAALELSRNSVGYEINEDFLPVIKKKTGFNDDSLLNLHSLEIVYQKKNNPVLNREIAYVPNIQDANYKIDPSLLKFKEKDNTYKVVSIDDDCTLVLDTGLKVKLLGIVQNSERSEDFKKYFDDYILKKEVVIKYDKKHHVESQDIVYAYVYLKNKIFINMYLIKSGLANVDLSKDYDMKLKFIKQKNESGDIDGKRVDTEQRNESFSA